MRAVSSSHLRRSLSSRRVSSRSSCSCCSRGSSSAAPTDVLSSAKSVGRSTPTPANSGCAPTPSMNSSDHSRLSRIPVALSHTSAYDLGGGPPPRSGRGSSRPYLMSNQAGGGLLAAGWGGAPLLMGLGDHLRDTGDTRRNANARAFSFEIEGTSTFERKRSLAGILDNNKRWVREMEEKDPDFFEKMGAPQTPEILYIGCSDSRVPANQICGLGAGEVFVHRNVGNLILPTDTNFGSVLSYAISHLDVKQIMVVGHYDCGAVRAAMRPFSTESDVLDGWLTNIRDVYRIYQDELEAIEDEEERHKRLVELNVIEQCVNLFKFTLLQNKRTETFLRNKALLQNKALTQRDEEEAQIHWDHGGRLVKEPPPEDELLASLHTSHPRIHGLVFDPKVGILQKLELNLRERFRRLARIYKIEDGGDGEIQVSDKWAEAQSSTMD